MLNIPSIIYLTHICCCCIIARSIGTDNDYRKTSSPQNVFSKLVLVPNTSTAWRASIWAVNKRTYFFWIMSSKCFKPFVLTYHQLSRLWRYPNVIFWINFPFVLNMCLPMVCKPNWTCSWAGGPPCLRIQSLFSLESFGFSSHLVVKFYLGPG